MDNRKAHSTVGTWLGIGLIVVLLYVASFGPMCWISARLGFGGRCASVVHRPLIQLAYESPALKTALMWYADLAIGNDVIIELHSNRIDWAHFKDE